MEKDLEGQHLCNYFALQSAFYDNGKGTPSVVTGHTADDGKEQPLYFPERMEWGECRYLCIDCCVDSTWANS
jgi:hypothetical protein